jgi:hypothetical protein
MGNRVAKMADQFSRGPCEEAIIDVLQLKECFWMKLGETTMEKL